MNVGKNLLVGLVVGGFSLFGLASTNYYECDLNQAKFYNKRYQPADNPGFEELTLELKNPIPLNQNSWRRNLSYSAKMKITLGNSLQSEFGNSLEFDDLEFRVNKDERGPRSNEKMYFSYVGESILWLHEEGILSEWNPMLLIRAFLHPKLPVEMVLDARLPEHQSINYRFSMPQQACRKK